MNQVQQASQTSRVAVLTGGLALFLLMLRLLEFWREVPARATDSYFYALKIRQFSADPELLSPLLSALGVLTTILPPFSPLDGYRLYVTLSLTVFSIGLTALASPRERHASISILVGVLLSSSLFIFDAHVAYTRQGLAIGLWCCGVALAQRGRTWRGIALLLMGSFTHVFAAGLALLSLLFHNGLSVPIRTSLGGLFLFAAAWHLSGHEKHLFAETTQYGWQLLCGARGCSSSELVEVVLWPILAILATALTIVKRSYPPLLLGLLLAYLSLNVLPWSTEGGMAERLAWSAPWIASIIAAISLAHVESLRIVLQAFSVLLIGAHVGRLQLEPRSGIPKSALAVIEHKEILQKWIPETSLVQAPRGVDYFVAYELERETTWRLVPPERLTDRDIFEIRKNVSRHSATCPPISTLYASDPHTVSCVNISKEWKISVRRRKTP